MGEEIHVLAVHDDEAETVMTPTTAAAALAAGDLTYNDGPGQLGTYCETCDLTYEYDPKYHRCDEVAKARAYTDAIVSGRIRPETWVEECMRRQRGVRR